jgi:type II secretory pathway predicted ATPase ExeA
LLSWNPSTKELPFATTCRALPPNKPSIIGHHLKLAGAREPILDEHALEAVHQVSFGIPRKIGTVVEQALTYAMFDQKRAVTAEMILKVKNLDG